MINNPISAANSVKESIGKEVTEFKEAPWVGENSRLEKGGYIAGDIAMLLVGNKGIGNAGKATGISGKGAKGARGIIRAENIGHKIEKSLIEKEFRKADIEQITKNLGKEAEKEVRGNVSSKAEKGNKAYKKSSTCNAVFSSKEKLLSHFEKHCDEFAGIYRSSEEYLQGARTVIDDGYKVKYHYKGEIRTGYVKFIGNDFKGNSKFAFVGTNSDGKIKLLHIPYMAHWMSIMPH